MDKGNAGKLSFQGIPFGIIIKYNENVKI